MAPVYTDQRLFSRPRRYPRSNELADLRTSYIRVIWMQMKSPSNHLPPIEQLYRQIDIPIRKPRDLRRAKPYDRSRLIGEPTRL